MKRFFTMACMIAIVAISGKVAAQLDLSTVEKIIPIYFDQMVMEDYDLDTKIVQDLRVNDTSRKLYLWEGSGYAAVPAVGKGFYGQIGGYLNLTVNSSTWSGLGFVAPDNPGNGVAPAPVDFTTLIAEGYRFHGAFKSTSNTRAHHLYICGTNEAHGHFAVGVGTIPEGPNMSKTWSTTDWNEVDFAMSELTGFSARSTYTGNYFCALSGAPVVDFAFDAVFLYKPTGSGIFSPKADNKLNVYVNGSEIIVPDSSETAQLYNTVGLQVGESVDGKINIAGLTSGAYIVKSKDGVAKVMIK